MRALDLVNRASRLWIEHFFRRRPSGFPRMCAIWTREGAHSANEGRASREERRGGLDRRTGSGYRGECGGGKGFNW